MRFRPISMFICTRYDSLIPMELLRVVQRMRLLQSLRRLSRRDNEGGGALQLWRDVLSLPWLLLMLPAARGAEI